MKDVIEFSDFTKVDIMVGEIIGAVIPEGSKKLIKMTVDFGSEGKRIIFSGISEWYKPEELVGMRTVFVVNIPAKNTPFGESQGMIFACDSKDGKPYILQIGEEVENGTSFH